MNTIIDILAYNTHYNNLAANYLVNESFLDTALMRNNIISISKMLNYTPRSKAAAKASLTLRIPKVNGNNVYTIPAGSLFTASDGSTTYNFYTLRNYSVQYDATDANGVTRDVIIEICEGDQITLTQGERHRLIGLDDYGVVAEIWQHTDKKNPSDEEDIVRVQDDFGR